MPQVLVDLEVADLAADELVITAGMADRKTAMIDRRLAQTGAARPGP